MTSCYSWKTQGLNEKLWKLMKKFKQLDVNSLVKIDFPQNVQLEME